MSGGGFGALDSMNKSLKGNQGMLKKYSAFEKLKKNLPPEKNRVIEFPNKMSSEELKALRFRTIKADRIHTYKKIIRMIVIIIAFAALLAILFIGVMSRGH